MAEAELVDHRGRPLSRQQLTEDHADPERRYPWLSPIRDEVAATLSPERLAGLLRAADAGDPLAYLTLAEEMEERELHYAACLQQRKYATTGAQVAVEAASESKEHRLHADLVRELTRRDAFWGDLVFDAQDALGKGYAVLEQRWETDTPDGRWWPCGWVWRDPRWFVLDQKTFEVLSLVDGTPEGEPLPAFKYVVHRAKRKSGVPIRGGLARIASIAYVLKRYTIGQLVRFLEIYGIPIRLGKYDRQTATPATKRELLIGLKKIGSDGAAIIPDDVSVEFLDGQRGGKGGGAEGFIGTADFWDSQVSKVVLGQTMTTDAGASYGQSKTHGAVALKFAQHDCRQTSATINRDVVRPFIELNFGKQERYPRVALTIIEPAELAGWSRAVFDGVDRGLEVDQRHVRQRLGLPEPEPGAKMLTPPPMGYNDPNAEPETDDEEPENDEEE